MAQSVSNLEQIGERSWTVLDDFDNDRNLNYLIALDILGRHMGFPSAESDQSGLVERMSVNSVPGLIIEFPRAVDLSSGVAFRLDIWADQPVTVSASLLDQFSEPDDPLIQGQLDYTDIDSWESLTIDLPAMEAATAFKLVLLFHGESDLQRVFIDNILFDQTLETESCVQFCNVASENGIESGGTAFGRGASAVDIDGDGDIDIFQTDNGYDLDATPHESRVKLNKGDGTFETIDIIEEWGILEDHLEGNWQALFFDSDNDGDQDLLSLSGGYQVESGRMAFYENEINTTGRFTDRTVQAAISEEYGHWWNAVAFDFDNDGLLDIAVTSRNFDLTIDPSEVPNAFLLYRNLGNNTFEEVSNSLGLPDPLGDNKNIAILDFDNDGCQDILISKWMNYPDRMEISSSGLKLFRNIECGSAFEEVDEFWMPAGIEYLSFANSILDYDQDGWQDIYLGRFHEQDIILINNRDGTFTKHSTDIGLDMDIGQQGIYENTMGLAVNDFFNDDGYPDILIGCGNPWMTAEPLVYRHTGNSLGYERASEDFSAGHALTRSHGACMADFDADGDLDIFWNLGGHGTGTLNADFLPAYYENQRVESGGTPSAFVKLEGEISNRDGIGTRIEVKMTGPGGEEETRYVWMKSADGFMSQDASWLKIPLGPSGSATALLDITWPSGVIQEDIRVSAGDRLLINELQRPTSTLDQLLSSSLSVFPNPASEHLEVRLDKSIVTGAEIVIQNPMGQSVQTNFILAGSSGKVLDIGNLPSGYYLLTIQQGVRLISASFVKQ